MTYKKEETEVDLDKHRIWNKTGRDYAQLSSELKELRERFDEFSGPATEVFRQIRETELRKAAGSRWDNRMRDRNVLAHGGNVTGDVFTIRHAEKWDPDNAKTCKRGFIEMYGISYEKVQGTINVIPEAVLMVLNIHFNITKLQEWKPLKWYSPKSSKEKEKQEKKCQIGNEIAKKALRIQRQLASHLDGSGLDHLELSELENTSKEIVKKYNEVR